MLRSSLLEAIRAGEAFLVARQDADGAWRDYRLEPGSSDGWITAVVGSALAMSPLVDGSLPAIRRAAEFLHEAHRGGGWGYNAAAATDADSTVWALMFLAAIDDLRGHDPIAHLSSYIDESGGVHTFRDAERFGSWAGENPEVSGTVGAFLVGLQAPRALVARLLARCLATRAPRGDHWPAFWWTTPAYATAQSARFLKVAGALDDRLARRIAAWLSSRRDRRATSLELAQLAGIAASLESAADIEHFAGRLLRTQGSDSGWGPSHSLVVPGQRDGRRRVVASDDRRLMSTASALMALKAVV